MSDNQPSSGALDTRNGSLPEKLRPLFWDCRFEELDLVGHREFVIGRILSTGDWNALHWLRRCVGDEGLRSWMERRRGRGLTPQQLRFWELILNLPRAQVDEWLMERNEIGWDDRVQR